MKFPLNPYRHLVSWALALLLHIPLTAFANSIDSPAAHLDLPVNDIVVSGNNKTQTRFILKWAAITPGQILTLERLTLAQQNIMDTGLFKEIHISTSMINEQNLQLSIAVVERYFSLILPRISRNGDGDVKTGLRLRMHNLNGADQTLEALLSREEEADGDDSEEFRLGYHYPFYSAPYEIDIKLQRKIENSEIENFANIIESNLYGLAVTRDWFIDNLNLPLSVQTALSYEKQSVRFPYPEALIAPEAGTFNRIALKLIYDDVHLKSYRRLGRYYSIELEQGFNWLGSDYDSTIVTAESRGFYPINTTDNFNFRFYLSTTDSSPFDYPLHTIGGSSDVRGLLETEQRGDTKIFANLETLISTSYRPIKYSLFVDIGNIFDRIRSIDLTDLRYSVGVGLRWQIQSFVNTHLFIDYAYDVEGESGKVYGGTSLEF